MTKKDAVAQQNAENQNVGAEYVGAWNSLISTTNWEKGRIICEWRDQLASEGAEANAYSDEAWTRLVGGVTSQHVGRLRRVYRRFAETREDYAGLYWSHFQAALDWNDAEMWLEGAVGSGWSVSQMRRQRWEALGAPDELKPRDEDIIVSELDEDVDPALDAAESRLSTTVEQVRPASETSGADEAESAEEIVEMLDEESAPPAPAEFDGASEAAPVAERRVQPFANLPTLPDDLGEAFEAFKLAILRHKTNQWQEIAANDVVATLEALKELALAP